MRETNQNSRIALTNTNTQNAIHNLKATTGNRLFVFGEAICSYSSLTSPALLPMDPWVSNGLSFLASSGIQHSNQQHSYYIRSN